MSDTVRIAVIALLVMVVAKKVGPMLPGPLAAVVA